MKLVVQRVKNAKVEVEGKITGQINEGFLVLLGVAPEDTEETADFLAEKLCNLRIFEDENEKMNLSIKDIDRRTFSSIAIYTLCRLQKRE